MVNSREASFLSRSWDPRHSSRGTENLSPVSSGKFSTNPLPTVVMNLFSRLARSFSNPDFRYHSISRSTRGQGVAFLALLPIPFLEFLHPSERISIKEWISLTHQPYLSPSSPSSWRHPRPDDANFAFFLRSVNSSSIAL